MQCSWFILTISSAVFLTVCILGAFQQNHMSAQLDDRAKPNSTSFISGKLPTGSKAGLLIYRRLFKQQHAMQVEAVKSLQSYKDTVKQYKMVHLMLQQIYKVVKEAQLNLTASSYWPGDDFPQNDTVRQALSQVLENTAMFGELVLRLPDPVHQVYDKSRDWQILMSWCVWFTNETGILDEVDSKLIHLMAQEMNLMEKDGNYVNPYSADYQLNQIKKDNMENISPVSEKKRKKSKPKQRGPRLSPRTDL